MPEAATCLLLVEFVEMCAQYGCRNMLWSDQRTLSSAGRSALRCLPQTRQTAMVPGLRKHTSCASTATELHALKGRSCTLWRPAAWQSCAGQHPETQHAARQAPPSTPATPGSGPSAALLRPGCCGREPGLRLQQCDEHARHAGGYSTVGQRAVENLAAL